MAILPKKGASVHLRLTQSDYEVLVACARREGETLSVFVREAIRQYLLAPEEETDQAFPGLANEPRWRMPSSDGESGA